MRRGGAAARRRHRPQAPPPTPLPRTSAATMTPTLSLPRLHSAIPTRLVTATAGAQDLAVLTALVRGGLLSGLDLPAHLPPLAAAEAALAAWVGRRLRQLAYLAPAFSVALLPADASAGPSPQLAVGWRATACPALVLGERLQQWQQRAPGMGAATLRALQRQTAYPLYGPGQAMDTAQTLYWDGAADEHAVLAATRDPQARRALAQGMLRRAEFDQAYPCWAYLPGGQGLSLRALAALQRDDRMLARPAWLLQQLLRGQQAVARLLRRSGLTAQASAGEFDGYGGKLLWRADDLTARLFDLAQHYATQDACHSWASAHRLALDQPQQLRAWRRYLALQLDCMVWIDALLVALAQ